MVSAARFSSVSASQSCSFKVIVLVLDLCSLPVIENRLPFRPAEKNRGRAR